MVATANALLELEPNNVEWLSQRGGALWGLNKKERAIADYNTCIKLHPTAELYETRAWFNQAVGEYTTALNDIREAIKLKPKTRFFLKESRLLMEHGELKAGLAAAKKGLSYLSSEPAAARAGHEIACYDAIGLAYLSNNQPKETLEALSKALDLSGWTEARKKNDRAAMLTIAKSDGNRVLRRGEAYEKLGKLPEAISDYELAVSAYPKSFPFRRSLLRAYRKTNQDTKALVLVTQLLQEDDSPDLYYKRSEIYKKLGKEAQANVDLARARQIESKLMGGN